jgi:hypothetical protein
VFKKAVLKTILCLTRRNVAREWRNYTIRNSVIYSLYETVGDTTDHGRWGGYAALTEGGDK